MYYDGLYYNLEAASTILDKKTTLSEWGIMSLMGRFKLSKNLDLAPCKKASSESLQATDIEGNPAHLFLSESLEEPS